MKKSRDFTLCIRCNTYNHSAYITDAFDGFVIQQTNFPFVAVIVDDASTDGEQQVISAYLDEHFDHSEETGYKMCETEDGVWTFACHKENVNCCFMVVCLKRNLFGNPKKRELIEEWLDAKYIASCEGDDYWTDPLKLQKQVDYMEQHPECGLCITDFRMRHDRNSVLSKAAFREKRLFQPKTFEEHLFNAGYIGPMTWVYRREIFNEIFNQRKVSGKRYTDGSFALALDFFALSTVCYLDEVTAVYRIHEGSATNQNDHIKAFNYLKGVFITKLEYAKKYHCDEMTLTRLKMQDYTTYMLDAIEAGDRGFVKDAISFYHSQGMEMQWYIQKCKEYVKYKKQYKQVYSSKSYRLGKSLLKPFKMFKE